MSSNIQQLLASEPDRIISPTYDFIKNLPYVTDGQSNRQAALEKVLERLYLSITGQDYEATIKCSNVLSTWIALEHDVPIRVRAELARIYYHLALAPGMEARPAKEFSNMVPRLLRPLFERSQHAHLHSEHMIDNAIVYDNLAEEAQAYFDPGVRLSVLEDVLPYFGTSDPEAAAGAVKAISLIWPTEPGPESRSDYMPTFFNLFKRLDQSEAATASLLNLFSKLAESHLVSKHVSFGAYGIFDEIQSREIFAAISKLTRIDVGSIFKTSLSPEDRSRVASRAARWIAFSLSPLCLEQESSMLSSLKTFIASFGGMYHPNFTKKDELSFVAVLLYYLIHSFCWRYNMEQRGELATPQERRINDKLRQEFVQLLRSTVLSGSLSSNKYIRMPSQDSCGELAHLEPTLVVPDILKLFYNSYGSQVDGDSVTLSMRLLVRVCSIIAREKGLRCYLPHLMNLALSSISANHPELTTASCQFIRLAICTAQYYNLPLAEPGKSEGPTAAKTWIEGEVAHLRNASSVPVDYLKQLSDKRELKLLQSAFSAIEDFPLQILKSFFQFASNTYSGFDTGRATGRSETETDVLDTAHACLLSIGPEMLQKVMVSLSERLSSDPIPSAKHLMGSLVRSAVQADPKRGLRIFVPMAIERIRKSIDRYQSSTQNQDLMSVEYDLGWYVEALSQCLLYGGSSSGSDLLDRKDEVLELAQFAEKTFESRAYKLAARICYSMLTGLTSTYPTTCAVPGADQAAMRDNSWHIPNDREIQAAWEVFESRTMSLEQTIRDLMERHDSLSGANKGAIWLRHLTGAVEYMNDLVRGVATLFDPQHSFAICNGEKKPPCDSTFDEEDVAAWVLTHVQDFHRVLAPQHTLYQEIHKRRKDIGLLACAIHEFILSCQGEYSGCLYEVYKLYATFINDVGQCDIHQNQERSRQDYERWARHLTTDGSVPLHPPTLRLMLMKRYHEQLQQFGTGFRYMGDLDRRILQDLVEGCSSPFEAIHKVARTLLFQSVERLAHSAEFFLPQLLAKIRLLIAAEDFRAIESALDTLVHGQWSRHCPFLIPDMLEILTTAARMNEPAVSDLARKGIKEMAILEHRGQTVFPEDSVAEAIRPGQHSNLAQVGRISQNDCRDKARQRREKLGTEILAGEMEPRLCTLSVRVLIRPGFDPPPDKYIAFLAENALTADGELRDQCVKLLRDTIRDFLSSIRFNKNLERYIRTQGAGGDEQVLVVPQRDKNYGKRYLANFEISSDGEEDGEDILVDPASLGSLVWPAQFHACRRDMKPPSDDPQISRLAGRIGSPFDKKWFEKFLSSMKLEEESSKGGRNAALSKIWNSDFELLSDAFQLMEFGATPAKLEDVEDLVKVALEDHTKLGHHIAAATLLLGLMWSPRSRAFRSRVLEKVEPLLIDILKHHMPLANRTWVIFLHLLTKNRDPRRYPGLVRYTHSLRLDASDSVPTQLAKLDTLQVLLVNQGWRLFHKKNIVPMLLQVEDDILNSEVSAALGTTLACVYTSTFYDSCPSVQDFIAANKNESSLGIRPYKLGLGIQDTVNTVLEKISTLRKKEPFPHPEFHRAAKMVLAFVDGLLCSNASGVLVHKQLLHPILDEMFLLLDAQLPEEMKLEKPATAVLLKLCHLPFRDNEPTAFWEIVVGKTQSKRVVHRAVAINMIYELYLHRLYTSTPCEQQRALKAVSDKIQDPDPEIQMKAEETLKRLLFRSCPEVTNSVIEGIVENSIQVLQASTKSDDRMVAVRRLSAVVLAHSFITKSPDWMAKAMDRLAHEAGIDMGLVAERANGAVHSFKEIKGAGWPMVSQEFHFSDLDG
ncbi:unnamed protein product [Clonostachys solani]|uniref:Proteasome activator Blm10 middle HEAT repeats region domain-containing protein n=1 Tax=Clonostachys solani TaxID=160281 RepID=A0A9P0ENS3_9HYPO|nr:unnamed protein product [Clonostachys solani]